MDKLSISTRQKDEAIKLAKECLDKMTDVMHTYLHMESVLNYAQQLLAHYPEANKDVVEMAVWWHDTGRLYQDKRHAAKSVEITFENLRKLNMNEEFVRAVCDVIGTHSSGDNLKPTSLEGKILIDADKLDFLTPGRWQIGIKNNVSDAFEVGINKIPLIRNKVLYLDYSKELFDKLFQELKSYIITVDDPKFSDYKKRFLEIQIQD